MKKQQFVLIAVLVILSLILSINIVFADKPTEFDPKGNETSWANSNAFDEFGYNYNALMFSGRYCDFDRVIGGSYCDVDLIMKWSSEWLNKDRVRCAGTPQEGSSACEGSWLTNHQRGFNPDGSHWSYFVKILYPTGGVVDNDSDGFDDNTGGKIIRGSYIIIQVFM